VRLDHIESRAKEEEAKSGGAKAEEFTEEQRQAVRRFAEEYDKIEREKINKNLPNR
jgi:hypothetical protein